jgi:tetratricopeptide (TPR) repeat protein
MNSFIQTKFNQTYQMLEEGNLIDFGKNLIELFTKITCNCFFKEQKDADFKRHIHIVCNNNDEENFYINLAKGFVFLMVKDEIEAYKFLSQAISIENSCDLPYSLRASIKSNINPSFEEDAKTAVLLNPSARNYFVLARSQENINDELGFKNSLIYYGKAINLKPDFACAYNNRALRKKKHNDLEGAIIDFKKCIDINKKHWAYYELWFCLDQLEKYEEGLKFIELGSKIHPEKIDYQFALAVAYSRVRNYETSFNHFKYLLEVYPRNKSNYKKIEFCISNIKERLLRKAKELFNERNFKQAKAVFEDYISFDTVFNGDELGFYLYSMFCEDDLNFYLLTLLYNNNPEITIDEQNPIFIRLNTLKLSYAEKLENGKDFIEEEENVNKLREYQSNYIIGFGKHEGKELSSVICEDPEYVLWCIINLDHFFIEKFLFLNREFKNEFLYLLAIEHNLIKEKIMEKWMSNKNFNYNKSRENYHAERRNYDRDTFDALTDGQMGDWDDFGGDFDDVMNWLGK